VFETTESIRQASTPTEGKCDGRASRDDLFSILTNGIAVQEFEAMRRAHAALFGDYEKVFDRWCARRHQSSLEFAQLAQVLLEGRNPKDVLSAWSVWSKGEMKRIADDALDQMEVGASLARNIGNGAFAVMTTAAQQWPSNLAILSDPDAKSTNGTN
jgi:hypothetical protein